MPTVREYARLTLDDVPASLDQATISRSAFDWLAEHAAAATDGPALVSFANARSLKVANYVGVVETACGMRLEILPKHVAETGVVADSRSLLVRMISEALHLKPRVGPSADIEALRLPLPEWLASRFLDEVSHLIKRGLRQAYRRVDDRGPFLRGALDVERQIRSGPAGAHLIAHRHDVYTFNRAENRLLQSAVDQVLRATRSSDNWKRARELAIILSDVPSSVSVIRDLRAWSSDRLMADYAAVKPLCELILLKQTPFAVVGEHNGLSMLFPMEKLFEHYVAASLRRSLPEGFAIKAQATDRHLCTHDGSKWFGLKPDIVVTLGEKSWVVDAKWKLLQADVAGYGLSQADFYQLFAYGHAYLAGTGETFLVYPRTSAFDRPLAPFRFSDRLMLQVLPFDLVTRTASYSFLDYVPNETLAAELEGEVPGVLV